MFIDTVSIRAAATNAYRAAKKAGKSEVEAAADGKSAAALFVMQLAHDGAAHLSQSETDELTALADKLRGAP